MQIAIMGAGAVGGALGRGWSRAGHGIHYGVTDPRDAKHAAVAEGAGGASIETVAEAASRGEIVVLAVPWAAVPDVIAKCGSLDGRIVLDATNPLEMVDGALRLTIGFSSSGGEEVACLAAGASVFKTMNQVGFAVMDDASGYPVAPIMFVAGDDAARKATVLALVGDLGFEARDAGSLDRARLLEPYAMVWIEQAVLHGAAQTSAFAFLQKGSRS